MIGGLSISAVLFVFNEEKYLPTMLDSILDQTEKVDTIIVVDDYSTDGTKGIVEEYTLSYPEIIYCLSKEKGKVYALETGLNLVKTDLFFVCAGDDMLNPNFVEYLYCDMLVSKGIRFCYSNYRQTDENLRPIVFERKHKSYDVKDLIHRNFVSGYLFGYAEIINEILPFPKGLKFEDWYVALRLSIKFGQVNISEQAAFLYRRHSNSATSLNRSREKYLSLVRRDRDFFYVMAECEKGSQHYSLFQERVEYLDCLLKYSFKNFFRAFNFKTLNPSEILKCIFFPIFLRLKYTRQ